jgi:pimeloyl-ACP methyl ester carboxylesterase
MISSGRRILLRGLVTIAVIRFFPIPPFGLAAGNGESHTANLDGLKVHYTNYGQGDTALVFVHGWSCDETVWTEQAPALAEKMRTITIDLPGHGQSDKPEINYTMDLYTRAIDAVLRDAKVTSTVLVGHSNGTPVIRDFFRRFATKTRALVIVEGGLRPLVDGARMDKFLAPLRGANYEQAASKLIDSMTRPISDEQLRDRIKRLMVRTSQHVAVSEFEGTADPAIWQPDKIDVPVLMILAKQPIWTAEYEQFARSIVPNLDYQVWDNVSHFVMMEKPLEFNQAVLSFLAKNRLLPPSS